MSNTHEDRPFKQSIAALPNSELILKILDDKNSFRHLYIPEATSRIAQKKLELSRLDGTFIIASQTIGAGGSGKPRVTDVTSVARGVARGEREPVELAEALYDSTWDRKDPLNLMEKTPEEVDDFLLDVIKYEVEPKWERLSEGRRKLLKMFYDVYCRWLEKTRENQNG